MKNFVIFSFKETINDMMEEPLFWSNEDGWVDLSSATVFSEEEKNKEKNHLMDGIFVELPSITE